MTLLKRIKGFVAGLMVLAAVCLVVEQLVYIFLVPGYFWELSVSPVVWGLFSAVCFWQLWRFNQKFPDENSDESMEFEDFEELMSETNPATGLPMAGALDISGNPYGGDDSVGFDLI
ncbi:hypothetical protein [Endozoicomonas euniceicola]|uniref:Uncharacterized protein n=1 Tax=Endozoicomonas euniceicola TaxID=1234143 RepID=A0ABY6GT16_9GAMM|nr:hypothetical protein [Endozoicomonas euniceicola]UYM15906.1 hypothetical protein NX720_24315 [Endozoicomonas euniceicola]